MKLKLAADPTFEETVEIPIPGSAPAKIKFTFVHRTRSQFDKFIKEESVNLSDVDYVLKIASGWDHAEPFSKESIEALLENYHGATTAIVSTYVVSLKGAKEKNSEGRRAPSVPLHTLQ